MTRATLQRGPTHPVHAVDDRIVLAHGGGGQLTDELLNTDILPRIANPVLDQLLDAAILPAPGTGALALTIDSFVVEPWRFPGGDIGRLAVCGTVNDLAVSGARPLALALALIVGEGFPRAGLRQVMDSIAQASAQARVRIVTGDTKVIGAAARPASTAQAANGSTTQETIFITTAGVGVRPVNVTLGPELVRDGDLVLINGPIGDHGLAVMLARQLPEVQSVVKSDVAPLADLTQLLLERLGPAVAFMRDPTRGGLAGLTADLASRSGLKVVLDEDAIAVRPECRHAAEMLGLDPLEIANEGKVVAVVRPDAAQAALEAWRGHPLGLQAQIIGKLHQRSRDEAGCELRTRIGGQRIVAKPYGEQLPRIC